MTRQEKLKKVRAKRLAKTGSDKPLWKQRHLVKRQGSVK